MDETAIKKDTISGKCLIKQKRDGKIKTEKEARVSPYLKVSFLDWSSGNELQFFYCLLVPLHKRKLAKKVRKNELREKEKYGKI